MASDEKQLYGRIARVIVSVPSEPGGGAAAGAITGAVGGGSRINYHGTTRDELEINGGDGTDEKSLRVTFRIKRTSGKTPDTSEIAIYNLSKDSRAKLQQKGVKVTLEAGYENTGRSRIFIGDVRTASSALAKTGDWVTTLYLGDGERGYQHARVSQTFSPGATAKDVLKYLGDASGLQIGNIPDVLLDMTVTYDQGYVVSGRWSDEMVKFCRSIGYRMLIQDQTLQILPPGGTVRAQIPEISPESGLIGSPEFGTPPTKGKPRLIKFKTLLGPTKLNAKVRLKSRDHDGEVIVKKVDFEADTHSGPWYTHYEGLLTE